MKKGLVIIQDKNWSGKLPTKEIKKVIARFKELYNDYESHPTREVIGFELNGGDGMLGPGYDAWNNFCDWCKEKKLDAEYNSNDDVLTIRDELRYRETLKNKY